MVINIPWQLKSDINGYTFFSEVSSLCRHLEDNEVVFDFSECSWFEANLSGVLGAIAFALKERNNNIIFHRIDPKQEDILSRNNFLTYFGGASQKDIIGTTVKFNRFGIWQEQEIKKYIQSDLLDKPDMPNISDGLKVEITKSIFEIYSNAITHGKCEHVYSCGQYYPRKSPPHMYFTIVDLGNTIRSNVAKYLNQPNISGIQAIEWAIKEGNTTKTGSHPGGLGLSLIQEFITKNGGKIQIVSSNGYWEISRGICHSYTMSHNFAGTLVNLVFNLGDTSSYYLIGEFPSEKVLF